MSAAPPAKPEPGLREIRAAMMQVTKVPSSGKAVTMFLAVGAAHLAAWTGALILPPVGAALAFSCLKGITIAALFVIGHDACHGSFTASERLNSLIARLAFLPSWHPYASWELSHNRLHHCWTNLKGRDYVWTPLSVAEYQASPRWRKGLERIYRTLPGLGLYYMVEIWWRRLLLLRKEDRAQMPPSAEKGDRALVVAFAMAEIGLALVAARWFGHPAWMTVTFSVIVPFLIWNWLMGFVVLLHHTHPRVKWYGTKAEWSFFRSQVAGTVHVIFPNWFRILFGNITEHTAHHADPNIPLYHLFDAQRKIETRFPDDVIVTRFHLKDAVAICRSCQLYDYQRHQWLDWNGNPTYTAS